MIRESPVRPISLDMASNQVEEPPVFFDRLSWFVILITVCYFGQGVLEFFGYLQLRN